MFISHSFKVSIATAVVLAAGVGSSRSTTYNVPTGSYPTVASALAVAGDNDAINLVGDVSEPGFTISLNGIVILGNTNDITLNNGSPIYITGDDCGIVNTDIRTSTQSGDCVKLASSVSYAFFDDSYFIGTPGSSYSYGIDDWGATSVNVANSMSADLAKSIDALNSASYTVYNCAFYNYFQGINFYSSTTGNKSLTVNGGAIYVWNYTQSNSVCIRAKHNSSTGRNYISITNNCYLWLNGAALSGCYPLVLEGYNNCYLYSVIFGQCPNGDAWSKQATDNVYEYSVTYQGNCR